MSGFLTTIDMKYYSSHVSKNIDTCLNTLQSKKPCNNCETVCPKQIMKTTPYTKINSEECIDCNLCLVGCPTRSISFSKKNALSIWQALNETSDDFIYIGCEKSQNYKNLKLFCIASLPWEFIVYAALKKPVIFFMDTCSTCNLTSHLDIFKKSLHRAQEFLGDEYHKRILIEDKVVNSEIKKREIFRLFKKYTKSLTKDTEFQLLNDVSRKLMFKYLKQHAQEQNYGWRTLDIQADCIGCTICEKMCPNNAISITKTENHIIYEHSPVRCLECKLCQTVCLFGGNFGFKSCKSDNSLINYTTIKITPKKCTICGNFIPIEEDTICMECKSKKNIYNFFNS